MSQTAFTKTFISNIRQGDTVLDLGAGDGNFSRMFADAGARVIAVDTRIPDNLGGGVMPIRENIQSFIETDERNYDAIFMRNIIQFFSKEWVSETLFPWVTSHLKQNGVIAISTFYQEPEPPFDKPFRSLYSLEELHGSFTRYQEINSAHYDEQGLDLSGKQRHFCITELIVKKSNET